MGYCPYMCIFCNQVEDNGWGNRTFGDSEILRLIGRDIDCDDDRMTFSHCESSSCLRRWANGGDASSDDDSASDSNDDSASDLDDESTTQR